MLQWIQNNFATIIGSCIVAVIFVAIVYHEIRKKRIGGCGCGCSGCGNQSICCGEQPPLQKIDKL